MIMSKPQGSSKSDRRDLSSLRASKHNKTKSARCLYYKRQQALMGKTPTPEYPTPLESTPTKMKAVPLPAASLYCPNLADITADSMPTNAGLPVTVTVGEPAGLNTSPTQSLPSAEIDLKNMKPNYHKKVKFPSLLSLFQPPIPALPPSPENPPVRPVLPAALRNPPSPPPKVPITQKQPSTISPNEPPPIDLSPNAVTEWVEEVDLSGGASSNYTVVPHSDSAPAVAHPSTNLLPPSPPSPAKLLPSQRHDSPVPNKVPPPPPPRPSSNLTSTNPPSSPPKTPQIIKEVTPPPGELPEMDLTPNVITHWVEDLDLPPASATNSPVVPHSASAPAPARPSTNVLPPSPPSPAKVLPSQRHESPPAPYNKLPEINVKPYLTHWVEKLDTPPVSAKNSSASPPPPPRPSSNLNPKSPPRPILTELSPSSINGEAPEINLKANSVTHWVEEVDYPAKNCSVVPH